MDFIPFLSTLLCCLFFSLEYGILIGIAVNLLFVLYPAARPKITIVKEKISKHQGDIYVITPVDNVYFPAADNLRDKVLNCEGKNAIVIVDGKYMRTIDITLARSIVVFSKTIEQRGGKVIFWHFKPSVINVCLGLDDTLKDSVKSGELEDLIEEEPPHNSVEGVV
jgi:sodium-independent sulfate anion transporter 11